MSSQSIWKEQVDEALQEVIRSSVLVTNLQTNARISLGENGVIVRKPENDFKITTYPCISIYNLYDRFNAERFTRDPNPKIVERDFEKKQVLMESPDKPYGLTYQIDFWAKHQVHMNELTLQWLSKFTPYHNLNAKNMSGELCNIMMQNRRKEGLKKQDLLDGNERIFHSFMTYDMWVEINEEERYTLPMITDLKVRGNEINAIKVRRVLSEH